MNDPLTVAAIASVAPPQTLPVHGGSGLRHAVFVDPASRHLLALAQRVASAEVTTLLVGPTGSGKEVLARVLHESSPRARGPFVALNCAALPEHLIEDLLFGHEKGAFTGAHRDHRGLFEQAQGGTIFLDEIGEMPLQLQTKLLRVLQERQLTRLGAQAPILLDVRVVAATNKDLRQAMAAREFREDLYYRIATFRLQLLPLAQRQGDILPLALQSLAQYAQPGSAWRLTPQAQALLVQYPWPGNVRELENVMRRAMVLAVDDLITPAHLVFDDWVGGPAGPAPQVGLGAGADLWGARVLHDTLPHQTSPQTSGGPVYAFTPDADKDEAGAVGHLLPGAMSPMTTRSAPSDLHSAVRQNEHELIMAAIAAAPSRNEAARRLGISPRTLRYKLAQLREQLQQQAAPGGPGSAPMLLGVD